MKLSQFVNDSRVPCGQPKVTEVTNSWYVFFKTLNGFYAFSDFLPAEGSRTYDFRFFSDFSFQLPQDFLNQKLLAAEAADRTAQMPRLARSSNSNGKLPQQFK